MNNKLIISDFHNGYLLGFQLNNDVLVRIYDFQNENIIGNIYCGYIKDVVKNINAAFVEFDNDKKGYLSLNNNFSDIHQGERILVQVSGDRIKTKDYTLTTKINLNAKCLVLTVENTDISISRKITDEEKRMQLKEILSGYKNDEYGFILRTNSVNFSKEEIIRQAEELILEWNEIKRKFSHAAPKTVVKKNEYILKMCREYTAKFHGCIMTDNYSVYEKLNECGISVVLNNDDKISLCNKYSLEKRLREALSKKVWLKSGGYLVIEPTEALTVIDVNTGKAETGTKRQETFQKINIEAAKEIARQIQIRNLSGIIIADFINMSDKEAYKNLKNIMEESVSSDFVQCNIAGFTNLGLMEISRKKGEKPLYEIIDE